MVMVLFKVVWCLKKRWRSLLLKLFLKILKGFSLIVTFFIIINSSFFLNLFLNCFIYNRTYKYFNWRHIFLLGKKIWRKENFCSFNWNHIKWGITIILQQILINTNLFQFIIPYKFDFKIFFT